MQHGTCDDLYVVKPFDYSGDPDYAYRPMGARAAEWAAEDKRATQAAALTERIKRGRLAPIERAA